MSARDKSEKELIIVVIPEFIEIKSAVGVRSAFLSPQADGLKSCYSDYRLNGESTLEFMLPANSPKIAHLSPECTIWADGKVYNLLKDDAADIVRDEDNKLWAKFMAIERWNELDTKYIEPYLSNDPFIPKPADLAVIIIGGGNDLSGGKYSVGSAGHALYAVLYGSGWTIGTVDVPGIHDIEMEKASRLVLVKAIQNIWGGYLIWDSVNKIVHLRSGNNWQNYTGFQIQYKKNLKHITRTQSNRLITKLYAFGEDDLDIASVNDGKKYLTNNSYTHREYVGIYRNPDIYDAQELKDAATAELALVCRPKYLYRVETVDLRTLPEYSHENFTVGDMVDVIDPDVAPDSPRPRIMRHKYNLFKPWDCELDLGDPEERFIEKLKATFSIAGYVDDILNSKGQLSGYRIVDGSLHANKIVTNSLTVGVNVGLGSAVDETGVTTIVGGMITTDYIKALGLQVGEEITMGPKATISWKKVTDPPDIPAIPGYITSTKITKTTIESPMILGGTFEAGPVSGNHLEIDSDGITSYDGDTKHGFFLQSDAAAYSYMGFRDNGLPVGALLYMPDVYLSLRTAVGLKLELYSDGDMRIECSPVKTIKFIGNVDFSEASVTGLEHQIAEFG